MNRHYASVALRAAHRCEYCRAPEAVFNFRFEVEHVVPSSQDGPETDSNRALACRSCNLLKSDQTMGIDPDTGGEVALYDPRREEWDEHFGVNAETCEMIGRTEKGRATIACLRINSAAQQAARMHWKRLGLFP
jgi:hypothetical protein